MRDMLIKSLIALILLTGTLYAERSGPYIGIGYGVSDIDDSEDHHDQGYVRVVERRPQTPLLYAGAFINEHLSVELDYLGLDDYVSENSTGEQIRDSVLIVSAVAVAHYPVLNDHLDLFGRFGAGQVMAKEITTEERSYNEAAILFGAGIGYRPTDRLTFKLGYDRYTYDKVAAESPDAAKSATVIDLLYMALEVQF